MSKEHPNPEKLIERYEISIKEAKAEIDSFHSYSIWPGKEVYRIQTQIIEYHGHINNLKKYGYTW